MTIVIEVKNTSHIAGAVEQATLVLARGGLVAFPTDTVYGLGAHPLLEKSVNKIYEVKGRPGEKALPLLLEDISQMEIVATNIPEVAFRLAKRFFPGALTMILFKSDLVPDWVTGGDNKIALRVPDNQIPRALAHSLRFPVIGTSANKSGIPPACSAEEVMQQMDREIDLILDGGCCPGSTPSTVVDVTVFPPKILRKGRITEQDIDSIIYNK